MTYDDLVIILASDTGLHSDIVKKVMVYLPDALQRLPVDDSVRTPLGVFKKSKRDTREVKLPTGESVRVPAKTVVRLKPGSRLTTER